MKPRQRKPQTQTANLYCRGNSHRDILWYDETSQKMIYHNALYWNDDEEARADRSHIAWVKYPEHSMLMSYGGSSSQAGTVGVMDADRQFQYAMAAGGGTLGVPWVFGLECGITVHLMHGSSETNFWVSEDGIVWQHIKKSYFSPNAAYTFHFGEDGLCWFADGPTQYGEAYPYKLGFTIYMYLFSKDEETGQWDVELKSYSYTDKVNVRVFCCNTKQGCIVYTTHGAPYDSSGNTCANNPTYWHIDHAGVKTQKKYDLVTMGACIWDVINSDIAYAKVGNRVFCAIPVVMPISRYSTKRYYRIIVMSSGDQGATWTGETLEEYFWDQEGWVDPAQMKVNMQVNDGEVFVFYSMDKILQWKVRAFSTYTGTHWDEIALPTWLDMPVIQEGGGGISDNPGKTSIRIAIDPTNTSNYDVTLKDMIDSPFVHGYLHRGGAMFKNGKLLKSTDDTFWFYFGQAYIGGWNAFFDNRYLAESSRAFAWMGGYIHDTMKPDYVIPYDYVLG